MWRAQQGGWLGAVATAVCNRILLQVGSAPEYDLNLTSVVLLNVVGQ
jgi:hypothetical protein